MTQFQNRLIKYPKIFSLGSPENEEIKDEIVVIESKIDGANFRCRYILEENKLIFGSRNNELSYNAEFSNWIAIKSYKKAFEEYKDKFIPNVIYFSESMQKHTISYDNIPNTIGYDIWDLEQNKFWDFKKAKQAFEKIGIPFINVHYEGLLKNITKKELMEYIKQSPYRKEGDEGIVLKCYSKLNSFGRPLFAKIVTDEFKEQNKKVFKFEQHIAKTNDSKIVDEYLNDARFIKTINYFKDNDEIISMSLIPKLFKYISDDILSENILEITQKYDSINFKSINKIIATKSATMLKQYLMDKALI
jgi:hypothetical protein